MPSTQFFYDQHWHDRYLAIDATWHDIMIAGIMAIEQANGMEVLPPPDKKRKVGRPKLKRGPYKKKRKRKIETKEIENKVNEEEVVEEKKEEVKQPERYWLLVDKPLEVFKREFDFLKTTYDENLKPIREWVTVPFDEMELDSIFRIRDDGKVVVLNNFKTFKKVGFTVAKDGANKAMIEIVDPNKRISLC